MEHENINIDDSALVDQCRWGDHKAIETLVLKYQNRIYNVILKICANPDDAAELTQETFVKVLEKIETFEGKSRFYTWLFRIAVNLTINYCKRSVKLGLRSLDAEDDRYEGARGALKTYMVDSKSPDPERAASNKELHELLKRALMKLEDDQRAIIILRDIEGMNYAAIADVLDINLGTVKSRISRGRNNLREILETLIR